MRNGRHIEEPKQMNLTFAWCSFHVGIFFFLLSYPDIMYSVFSRSFCVFETLQVHKSFFLFNLCALCLYYYLFSSFFVLPLHEKDVVCSFPFLNKKSTIIKPHNKLWYDCIDRRQKCCCFFSEHFDFAVICWHFILSTHLRRL